MADTNKLGKRVSKYREQLGFCEIGCAMVAKYFYAFR